MSNKNRFCNLSFWPKSWNREVLDGEYQYLPLLKLIRIWFTCCMIDWSYLEPKSAKCPEPMDTELCDYGCWTLFLPCFCLWWIHEFLCRIDHGNWNFPKIKLQLWPYKVVALNTQTRNALCNMYTLLVYICKYIYTYTCVCIWRTASVEVHLHHCTAC